MRWTNCAAGLTETAIEKDLNKHELGNIVEFGLAHPAVRGISFGPLIAGARAAIADDTSSYGLFVAATPSGARPA